MDSIDYNFAHSLACFVGTSKTGEVFENRDALLTNSAAPVAEFNLGFLKRPAYKIERALHRALDFYRSGVPFRLHIRREHAAAISEIEKRGFQRSESMPVMVLSPIEAISPPADGLTIRRVESAEGLADFQTTAFASFGYPVELAPLALTEELMRLPHVRLFVGYADGEPACCSLLLITGEVAGIYWVGTLARYRRRGFGAAVTAHAVRAGTGERCRLAALQASKFGEPVYRRLGFATVREYLRFDHLPASG